MRIAWVVTGGFDESGREQVIPALLWLVERLARRHDVAVYVLRYYQTPRRYRLLGATVHDMGRPRGIVNQWRAVSAAMIADGPFDVVHGYWAMPAGLVASAVGRRLGVPAIVTCDSGEFVACPDIGYGLQSHWRGRIAVAAATRLATRVTVCSTYQCELARAHGLNPDVIPLGVDTQLFTTGAVLPDGPPFRLRDGPPFRLLCVASLNPVKDHATLLRAVQVLASAGFDLQVDIIGEDTMSGSVASQARALGVDDRVIFHGFRSSADLLPLYHRAHLFVLPSRHEAAGVVLLEAATCGVPVVGSSVGYLADWSPDAATGVEPGNPQALARAIEALLLNPVRRHAQAAAAARWARQHDADWTASAFEALYHEVLASPHHVARDGSRVRSRTPGS